MRYFKKRSWATQLPSSNFDKRLRFDFVIFFLSLHFFCQQSGWGNLSRVSQSLETSGQFNQYYQAREDKASRRLRIDNFCLNIHVADVTTHAVITWTLLRGNLEEDEQKEKKLRKKRKEMEGGEGGRSESVKWSNKKAIKPEKIGWFPQIFAWIELFQRQRTYFQRYAPSKVFFPNSRIENN